MPKDRKNRELKPGDVVLVPCKVAVAFANIDVDFNLELEPLHYPMGVAGPYRLALHGCQVELANDWPRESAEPPTHKEHEAS